MVATMRGTAGSTSTDVGTQSFRYCTTIGEPRGSGRVGRDQFPGPRQVKHTPTGQHHGRTQHRWIEIVRRQHPANACFCHPCGGCPAEMRSAAYHIRAAHHHPVTGGTGLLRNFLGHWEVTDARSLRAKCLTCADHRIIVAGHRQSGLACRRGKPFQCGGNGRRSSADLFCERTEIIELHAGTIAVLSRPPRGSGHASGSTACGR